ncbi:OLC1v1018080C1 [Oldenlandia corymbosa var. corymbosa]|uniref:OLC1v1018080C1 n=1 Tax=Oldenlandia corymbosa var. corymbosa TaxID=529605 RepID=A0AAV1EAV4_OLDCO|nr:OLC1v1018080C1 [Oldenlandia corymbosa var. corymbosa]
MRILEIYIPQNFDQQRDKQIWKFSRSGTYTVKSGYHVASNAATTPVTNASTSRVTAFTEEACKKFWKISIPAKIKWLIWKAANNALPTLQTLERRNIRHQLRCSRCESWHEDVEHRNTRVRQHDQQNISNLSEIEAGNGGSTQGQHQGVIIRVDGAFKQESRIGAAAWEILTNTGYHLTWGTETFYASSALHAEALACLRGLQSARTMGLQKGVLQTDNVSMAAIGNGSHQSLFLLKALIWMGEKVSSEFRLKKFAKQEQKPLDRISELSDDILISTLSLLTFENAARTSVLSKRWIDLWLSTSELSFDFAKIWKRIELARDSEYRRLIKRHRQKCVNWVNKVLLSHKATFLDVFRVRCYLNKFFAKDVDKWLQYVSTRRVKSLDLNFLRYDGVPSDVEWAYTFPHDILGLTYASAVCTTDSGENGINFDTRFGFNALRNLALKNVSVCGKVLEFFLHNCPFLESLAVECSYILERFEVCGPSIALKHLEITHCTKLDSLILCNANLVSLRFIGGRGMVLKNAPKLVDVIVDWSSFNLSVSESITCLSCSLSKLEVLTLKFRAEDIYYEEDANGALPCLTTLKQLIAIVWDLEDESLIAITAFIKASPNLEKFVLKSDRGIEVPKERRASRKGKALSLQHLKDVEFWGYSGRVSEVELVEYLLENAVALERIMIDPRDRPPTRCAGYDWPVAYPPVDNPKEDAIYRDIAKQQIQGLLPSHVKLKKGSTRVSDLQSEEIERIAAEIENSSVNKKGEVKENSKMATPTEVMGIQMHQSLSDGRSSGKRQNEAELHGRDLNAKRQLQWSEMMERDEKQGVWAKNDASKFKAPSGKLLFIPPKEVASQNIAQMQMEDVKSEAEYWESSIVCFVLFTTLNARDSVLNVNFYHFGSKSLIVKPWDVEKGINYDNVDYVPIWIRLYGLEVKFWNLNSLSRLVSAIGTPILVDDYTVRKKRVQFARILVEIKIAASVPDKLVFEDEKGNVKVQKIVYEWLPTRCTHCTEYGHLTDKCRLKLRKVEDKPKQPLSAWKKVEKKDEGRSNAEKIIVTDDNQRKPIVKRKDQSSCEGSLVKSIGQVANSLHEEGNLEKNKGDQSCEDETMKLKLKYPLKKLNRLQFADIVEKANREQVQLEVMQQKLSFDPGDVDLQIEERKLYHQDPKIWNKAALLKQVWQIASQKDALWIKWIHGVYIKSSSFWKVEAKCDASWQWKQLLKIRDQGKLGFAESSWLASNNDKYTVKSGYAWLTGNEVKARESQSIWSRMNVPKHSFIT